MSERTDPGAEAAASRRFRLGHPAALLVLVFSLALVIGIWRDARQRELQLAETQFRARVGRIANLVAERLDKYELTLKGGAIPVHQNTIEIHKDDVPEVIVCVFFHFIDLNL